MVGIVLAALAGPAAGPQRGVDVRSYEVGIVIPGSTTPEPERSWWVSSSAKSPSGGGSGCLS